MHINSDFLLNTVQAKRSAVTKESLYQRFGETRQGDDLAKISYMLP